MPWEPPWSCRDLCLGLLLRGGGGEALGAATCHGASFAPAGVVGRHRRRQRLQQLGGRAEANVLLRLSRLREKRQSCAAFAAGVAAQLVVARDGTVSRQDLHLAEDGLVSVTRLI